MPLPSFETCQATSFSAQDPPTAPSSFRAEAMLKDPQGSWGQAPPFRTSPLHPLWPHLGCESQLPAAPTQLLLAWRRPPPRHPLQCHSHGPTSPMRVAQRRQPSAHHWMVRGERAWAPPFLRQLTEGTRRVRAKDRGRPWEEAQPFGTSALLPPGQCPDNAHPAQP